jgi:hypothetical protein
MRCKRHHPKPQQHRRPARTDRDWMIVNANAVVRLVAAFRRSREESVATILPVGTAARSAYDSATEATIAEAVGKEIYAVVRR